MKPPKAGAVEETSEHSSLEMSPLWPGRCRPGHTSQSASPTPGECTPCLSYATHSSGTGMWCSRHLISEAPVRAWARASGGSSRCWTGRHLLALGAGYFSGDVQKTDYGVFVIVILQGLFPPPHELHPALLLPS